MDAVRNELEVAIAALEERARYVVVDERAHVLLAVQARAALEDARLLALVVVHEEEELEADGVALLEVARRLQVVAYHLELVEPLHLVLHAHTLIDALDGQVLEERVRMPVVARLRLRHGHRVQVLIARECGAVQVHAEHVERDVPVVLHQIAQYVLDHEEVDLARLRDAIVAVRRGRAATTRRRRRRRLDPSDVDE